MSEKIIVSNAHEEPTTTSLNVAEVFDKQHKNIIRDIEKILAGSNLSPLKDWFFESVYIDKQGKKRKCYEMTKDGFTLLAMGFSGQKAPNLVGAFFIFRLKNLILSFFLFYIVFQDGFNHIAKASVLFFCLLLKFCFQCFLNCNKYPYIFFRDCHNITPLHYYNTYISKCQNFFEKKLDKIISL